MSHPGAAENDGKSFTTAVLLSSKRSSAMVLGPVLPHIGSVIITVRILNSELMVLVCDK